MEADGTWHPTSDYFFSHPKVRKAGRDSALLFLAGLGYCGRYLTDGAIPKDALDVIAAEAWTTKKAATKLVQQNLWHDMGEHYQVHDWHQWNRTRDEAEEKRTKKSGAGALGNHRRWHVDRGITDPGCELCQASEPDPPPDPSPDRKSDRNCDEDAIAPKSQKGRKPFAEQEAEVEAEVLVSTQQQQTAVDGGDPSHAAARLDPKTVAGVTAVLMRSRNRYQESLAKANPPGWLIRTEQGIRGEVVAALPALVDEHPDWTHEQLAAAVNCKPIPAATAGPQAPISCDRCADHHGIYELEDGSGAYAICDHGLLSEAS
jgi:hypothetical protein